MRGGPGAQSHDVSVVGASHSPPSRRQLLLPLYDDNDDDYDYDSDNSLPSLTAPDSYPSTPAAKSIVGSLRVKIFSPNSTAQPRQSCSICMVDFDVSSSVVVNELPCEHYFHKDCIIEWLQRNNTCPLCRYKLPLHPNQLYDEYDAVSARATKATEGRVNTNTEGNGAASGSEDGDTLMTEV